jgi:hypothetical protein
MPGIMGQGTRALMAPKVFRLTDFDAKPTFRGIHHDPKTATSGYIEHLIEASVCTDAIASARSMESKFPPDTRTGA